MVQDQFVEHGIGSESLRENTPREKKKKRELIDLRQ
jgi:hypothetical protein